MKNRSELLKEFAEDPHGSADYVFALQGQLAEAQALIAELKLQLFGSKAEKLSSEQEEQLEKLAEEMQAQGRASPPLSQEVLQEALQKERKEERKRSKERRRRHMPPVELEKQTVVLESEEKICPISEKQRPRIGQEVTTEYDLVPAKLIIRKTVRPKYGSCGSSCCEGVAIAPLPPRLVPQSKLGLGLAVFVLLSRFDDHVAYYTLERNFAERHRVAIPRQQMVQWVEKIAHLLLAIYWLIWEEMKEGGYLQVDETPVKVLDPEVKGKAGRGYLWFYSVPGGDVFLEFCKGRGREGPQERLKGFEGTIQTDAYEVYNCLRKQRPRTLKRIGCLGHSRRRFFKALQESVSEGLWFILKIRELYKIEDELRDCEPQERRRGRLLRAPAIWLEMKRKAEVLKKTPRVLPKSSLGKAVRYFLKEYTAMVGYLRDGRFEIDNNLVENDVRPPAVGRKRWLFIGHPDAGWRSAVIYTIIQSCRRRGINTQEYLSDVLRRLPAMTTNEVRQLVPSRWKPQSSEVNAPSQT
ncbi:MAG: IS66 family transposase [Planctomycetota bacterium]|jgi:transposase|nr:IS66 family transposase [Planctomycetota bacterium]